MSALKWWNGFLGLPELDEDGELRERPPGYSKVHARGLLVDPPVAYRPSLEETRDVWENRFVRVFGYLYGMFMVTLWVGLPLTFLIWIL